MILSPPGAGQLRGRARSGLDFVRGTSEYAGSVFVFEFVSEYDYKADNRAKILNEQVGGQIFLLIDMISSAYLQALSVDETLFDLREWSRKSELLELCRCKVRSTFYSGCLYEMKTKEN
ncbi:unnamed protein product [Amoebophrya sp. A120]|nr:unnamed protein product [Amoebophrya sp. A120]|eukprot:GSA120T00012137001.1